MRQRPRSSERRSRGSHGGVGAPAAAGDAWSGMLEKVCSGSGEDVTDDEEPSSWTIRQASPTRGRQRFVGLVVVLVGTGGQATATRAPLLNLLREASKGLKACVCLAVWICTGARGREDLHRESSSR